MRVLLENTTFLLHKVIRIAGIIRVAGILIEGGSYMRKYGSMYVFTIVRSSRWYVIVV